MKPHTLTLFLFLALAVRAIAQVPQGIPYQAVARDAQGQPLASRSVKVRFSVLDSILTGNAVYVETHATTTSSLGLFSVNIGMGTLVTGTFSGINWGVNSKFLKVELDTTASGNNYVNLGTQQMMSVPYALYAGSAIDTSIWKRNGADIYYPGKVGIGKVNFGNSFLDVGGSFIELARYTPGQAGLVKNLPVNTPGYDGSLMLGITPNYSTIELHHQLGGYRGGSGLSNFFTTFNTTEGGVSAGERMRITPSGNVGIGTTVPTEKLEINSGGIRINGFYGIGFNDQSFSSTIPNGNEGAKVYVDNTITADPNKDFLIFEKKDGNSVIPDGGIIMAIRGNDGVRKPTMFIDGLGRVGINTLSQDQFLSVNGNASKAGGGSWATFSDLRVKRNIRRFSDGLNVIMILDPVTFQYKENSGYSDTQKEFIGFIAQDVEKVAPYMVEKYNDSEGPSSLPDKRILDESALSKILVNAVKEQQLMIQDLKNELESLKQSMKESSSKR